MKAGYSAKAQNPANSFTIDPIVTDNKIGKDDRALIRKNRPSRQFRISRKERML
jgi:hypothetical protein